MGCTAWRASAASATNASAATSAKWCSNASTKIQLRGTPDGERYLRGLEQPLRERGCGLRSCRLACWSMPAYSGWGQWGWPRLLWQVSNAGKSGVMPNSLASRSNPRSQIANSTPAIVAPTSAGGEYEVAPAGFGATPTQFCSDTSCHARTTCQATKLPRSPAPSRPRLPQHAQLHRHDLHDRRQAQLRATHLKQRGALLCLLPKEDRPHLRSTIRAGRRT